MSLLVVARAAVSTPVPRASYTDASRRRSATPTGRPLVACRSSAESGGGMGFTDEPDEAVVVEPRMSFGLDVHRRIHLRAMKQMAYQAQWRAYCERAKRDWRDCVSDDDETVLCSFQYELERGIERFEAAKRAGELGSWPPRTLHPTQGLPALQTVFRVAVRDECDGRETLFRTE